VQATFARPRFFAIAVGIRKLAIDGSVQAPSAS
jgi:hypothetical protein